MKHLSQMTREELWALDLQEIGILANEHRLEYIAGLMPHEVRPSYLIRLETLRLELQQDSADSRQDR